MYSIKAAAQATGLTVETLRAWERRYGIVAPARDASGRRVYRAEDVLRLRRLREATERGHPIGRLAALSDEHLARLLDEPSGEEVRAASRAIVERILDAARRLNAAECEQALALAVATLPPPRLVDELLRPLLREVGERWHRGELAICEERLVSTLVRRHVGLALDTYDRGARNVAMVFATLPGERHELGLLMAAMVCASRGFRAHYLGADLPAGEIARFARESGAAVVALSFVLREPPPGTMEQLRELAASLPQAMQLWLGGAAAQALPRAELPPDCVVLPDTGELERRLEMIAA
jgi:DNA-binding transcriptional MerR regulator/methylmalonyl-CoA mutase cobalamin-binding subunit